MIDQAASHEHTALVVALYEAHHDEVYAYLYRLMDDPDAAQDLVQEAFLRALRSATRLPEVDNRRAWIYRIATNLAFRALRRRRRFAWLPWRAADSLGLAGPDVAEHAGAGLEAALQALPADMRAPLLLRATYGLSVREVAEAMGLSEGSVKMRLYRGREVLRQALEGEDGE